MGFESIISQIDTEYAAAEKRVHEIQAQLGEAQAVLNRLRAAKAGLTGRTLPTEGQTRSRKIILSSEGSALRTAKIKMSRLQKSKPKNQDAIKDQEAVVDRLQKEY